MQYQKGDIRSNILKTARIEFLDKGYKDASMRTMAKNANVGLSNIYNYFKNKDEIFCEVMRPLTSSMDKMLNDHNDKHFISLDVFTSEVYLREMIDAFVGLIKTFKEELKLLLFLSHGSSLANFVNEYTDRHTTLGLEYIRLMKEKYPKINGNISVFFIHTMSSWWITIIGEIVTHDLLDQEIETFVAEYIEFGTAGWKRIMKA
ncbi:MAG: TetR/AcrR family transcriptional regulator [Carboxylicivirga sp.]|jgi:AcrR family transcriptional regulator|nr:TetR/AcrR family transcriptional regulator [Carboxylicivirga sp.]MCT4645736.1 TetR/AcrR family transcriptional regulator [Carboxylicivirga sp.]